jgi:flagellar capping protein FliD
LGSTNITIAPDTAQITSNTANFVKAYSTLVSTLGSLQSDPSAGTALQNIHNQMSRTLNSTQSALAGSPYTSPSQVGITTQDEGALALNKQLTKAP